MIFNSFQFLHVSTFETQNKNQSVLDEICLLSHARRMCTLYRGVKATDKRDGGGAYNWGTIQDDILIE